MSWLPTVLNASAAIAAVAVSFFAGVQLWQQRQERRERRRAAFASLYGESLRLWGVGESLKDKDLVMLARADAFEADDFLPLDWGTVLRLTGEVSAGTAVLAAYAYEMVAEARRLGRLLIYLAHHSPAAEEDAREFERQIKKTIKRASELMDDALRSAPHWIQAQPVTTVDLTSEVGKMVEKRLRDGYARIRSRRQTPILGPIGRVLGRTAARLALWLDPTAFPWEASSPKSNSPSVTSRSGDRASQSSTHGKNGLASQRSGGGSSQSEQSQVVTPKKTPEEKSPGA